VHTRRDPERYDASGSAPVKKATLLFIVAIAGAFRDGLRVYDQVVLATRRVIEAKRLRSEAFPFCFVAFSRASSEQLESQSH